MKQFVFAFFAVTFASLVFAGVDDDLKALEEKLTTFGEKCEKSTGISQEDLSTLFQPNSTLAAKVGCFIHCLAKEFNLLKDNNMVDKEKLNQLIESVYMKLKQEKKEKELNAMKAIINECIATQQGGTDTCAVGKSAGECIKQEIMKFKDQLSRK